MTMLEVCIQNTPTTQQKGKKYFYVQKFRTMVTDVFTFHCGTGKPREPIIVYRIENTIKIGAKLPHDPPWAPTHLLGDK